MRSLSLAVRAGLLSLFTLLLTGFVSVGAAPAAEAHPAGPADVYRYWAYFTVQDDAFVAQQTGPAGATPKDGDIEAYRYAAPASLEKPNLPRADLAEVTFDAVCGDKAADAGTKRVAVLLDYGVDADASNGETPPEPEALCAVVPTKANGLQTLQEVAPDLRTQKSSFGPLVCGISGYPATGCADVKAPKGSPADGPAVEFAGLADDESSAGSTGSSESDTSAASDSDDDPSNVPMLLGIAVIVAAIVVGGILLQRRGSRA
jgi:hypothetical protein